MLSHKRSCCNRTTGNYYRSVVLKTTFELPGSDAKRLEQERDVCQKTRKGRRVYICYQGYPFKRSFVSQRLTITHDRADPLFSRFQTGSKFPSWGAFGHAVSLGEWNSFSKSCTMTDIDVENNLPPQWLSTTGKGNLFESQNMQNVF